MTTGAMSTRAMAAVMGVSQRTVMRDLGRAPMPNHVVVGLDGKHYHSRHFTDVEVRTLVKYAHDLRHQGSTVRSIVAWFAEQGIPRSVGWVSGVLRNWRCGSCSGAANETPEHQQSAQMSDPHGSFAAPEQLDGAP